MLSLQVMLHLTPRIFYFERLPAFAIKQKIYSPTTLLFLRLSIDYERYYNCDMILH